MDNGIEQETKRPRRRFTEEFKAGAVRLVLVEGKSITGVARDLGVAASAWAGGSSRLGPTRARASAAR